MKNINKIDLYCVDLGSRAGIPENWQKFSESLTIDAFDSDKEADDKGYKKLNNVTWHSFGLAKTSGKLNFYITSTSSGSSIYQPNEKVISKYSPSRYWKVKEIRKLNFLSFKDFLKINKRKVPELIKLDTQGSELDILKSLTKNQLKNVLAIDLEIEFQELYKNQPLFRDIDKFLADNNFEIMDLRTHRSYRILNEERGGYLKKIFNLNRFPESLSAKILAGDAIYIKKMDMVKTSKKKLLKTIKILILYNFFDEAVALIFDVFKRKIISKSEKNALIEEIKCYLPKISFRYKQDSLIRKVVSGINLILSHFYKKRKPGKLIGWSKREWPDQ